MNTYDFDKTIFYPDSSACFYRYCLLHFPGAVLPTIPANIRMALRYKRGEASAKALKEQLFSFLPGVPNIQAVVSAFWEENESRIGAWYLQQKKADDLILSASPRFLLAPVCARLGISLVATEMDPLTGSIKGHIGGMDRAVCRWRRIQLGDRAEGDPPDYWKHRGG